MRHVPHQVAILALDSVVPFDLAIPHQVFGFSRAAVPARYQVRVCSPKAGRVRAAEGIILETRHGLRMLAAADTIIVPGLTELDRPIPREVCSALRRAHARGARLASICTGAFVLAAAGLLDGRRATTHWQNAEALAARYPLVQVDPAVLYVADGSVFTSAGLAAGIDLCLHLVQQDFGAEFANSVARELVVAPHRSGGQAQFIDTPLEPGDGGSLEATRIWALAHLGHPLTLARLAAHARMNRRTFTRRFRSETGMSALQWVVYQRVLLARRLLETTDLPVSRIAGRAGFGSGLSLRLHFQKLLAVSPLSYRRAFRTDGEGESPHSKRHPLAYHE